MLFASRKARLLFTAIALAILAIGMYVYADWYQAAPPDALTNARYVGRQSCVDCHQQQHEDWTGSHHDHAMDLATDETVLADFDDVTFERLGLKTRFFRDGERFLVNTDGPDGKLADFEVKYTFGVDPLQQYMVEFDDGRVQVLRHAWDTHRGKWFYVTPPDVTDERILPGDPLHWTGITQNWNSTCAICHSTNLQKNYDLATDSYNTTWSEIDVSCEECHGPASLHVELASANSLFWDRVHGYGLAKLKNADPSIQVETCAKCHARRNDVHPDFRPGRPLLDSYEPALLSEGLYHADGQILDEVYVYGSFLQSKMHAKGVRCSDCHNPHSLALEAPGNQMCAKCHQPAKYDVVAHHHHPDPQPGKASAGSQCVECHMPATTYMVVDPRRDHSLRVPRPDLTVSTGTPNACNQCHTKPEEDAAWAAAKIVDWFGEDRDSADAVAEGTIGSWPSGNWPRGDWHWAPAFAAGRAGKPEGEALLIETVDKQRAPAIVRATAVDLLQRYESPAARRAIEKSLDARESLVRLAAVRGVFPDPRRRQTIDLLAERLADSSLAVRIAAARRLVGVPSELLSDEQIEAQVAGLAKYRERQAMGLEHAGTHLNLSSLELELGNVEVAIAELRTAIKLEPYLSGARGQLASLLEQRNDDAAEIKRLRTEEVELIERDAEYVPDNANIRYRLGLIRYKLGDDAGAEAALTEASRLEPSNESYLLALALMQEDRYRKTADQKHLEAAVATLRRLNELTPGSPTTADILRRLAVLKERNESRSD